VDLIGNRTVPDLLDEQAERRPDSVALAFEDRAGETREYRYDELPELAARVARGLSELGIGRGDKVVVHLANCPEMVLSMLGLAHLGAVLVPSNTGCTAPEMLHVAGWSDASLVVTSADYLPLFEEVRPNTPDIKGIVLARGGDGGMTTFDELLKASPLPRPTSVESETPLEILFTSGTTALPKGVVLTHANWLWSGERSSRTSRLDQGDRLLSSLPLFHVNAQSLTLLHALTLGGTAIFLEQFSASRYMAQIRRHAATHTSVVAMQVRTLLAQPENPADADHALRRVAYAINVTDAEKEAFERRFGVELINGYGLSEAMTEVATCPVYGPKRWPSIRLPVVDRQVRLVDDDGAEVPQGEIGEITVSGVPGRTIMLEYYKDPDATARTVVDGWLHTGDNGYFDELGYLYFFDRSKDIIKRAGENVSASEVEGVLVDHPDITTAAVIAVPDPIRDEAVKAFIVTTPGVSLTEDDVRAHCERHLARFKVPTVIEFRDQLPTTSIGKIEKRTLRRESQTS
jgi:crotonobetaine/carnitine-CoA ligase